MGGGGLGFGSACVSPSGPRGFLWAAWEWRRAGPEYSLLPSSPGSLGEQGLAAAAVGEPGGRCPGPGGLRAPFLRLGRRRRTAGWESKSSRPLLLFC